MMQVHSEELSALLDGELDAERAAHVRAMIEADPELRREYAALAQLDARLRHAAEASAFTPHITGSLGNVPSRARWCWVAGAAMVLGLLIVRFLPKFIDVTALSLCLQIAAWAAMLVVMLRLTRASEPLAASEFALRG